MCMTTKLCAKCNNKFLQRQEINGKKYNLQRRKFCLDCSPFMKHNTKNLNKSETEYSRENGKHKPYNQWSRERKQKNIANLKSRRNKRKFLLVKEFGGKCCKCGYNKNYAALEFHHRNPSEKKFVLSAREITAKPWVKVLQEAVKCDLLCSNCHAEHHHPQCEIKLVDSAGIEPASAHL